MTGMTTSTSWISEPFAKSGDDKSLSASALVVTRKLDDFLAPKVFRREVYSQSHVSRG